MKPILQTFLRNTSLLTLIFSFILAPVSPIFAQEGSELIVENTSVVLPIVESNSETTNTTLPVDTNSNEITNPEILNQDPGSVEEETKAEDLDSKTDTPPEPEQMEINAENQPFNPENLTASFPKTHNGDLKTDESSGSLNYSFPIVVPPGRNNMEPNLNLSYNNQKLNNVNIFGYGWDINIPYIERLNKTGTDKLYTDNYFTSSLSGELVLVSGNTYAPKVEDGKFLNYTFDGTYWTVKSKDGKVYKFGTTNKERQDDSSNTSKVFKWMLEEERDTNDNYIKYKYYKKDNQIYPEKIEYTNNATEKGIFEVFFNRELRDDVNKSYSTTFLVTTKYRINEIIVKIRGTWVRKYDLDYKSGDNGFRSLLSSITESGQSEELVVTTLPLVNFNYYTSTPNWTETNTQFTSPLAMGNGTENFLDINGDSLPDIIESYNTPQNPIKNTYINNNNGTWSLNSGLQSPILFKENEIRGGAYLDEWDQGVRMGDVNGDMLPEIIKAEDNANGNGGYDAYINTNGSSWNQNNVWNPITTINGDNNTHSWGTNFIDLNNDDLKDIIRYQNTAETQINNGNGFGSITNSWNPPVILSGPYTQFADLNADNLPDIIHSNYNSSTGLMEKKLYLNVGNGNWILDNSLVPPVNLTNSAGQDIGYRFIDLNNDGLIDFISQYWPQSNAYLNTGIGWKKVAAWEIPDYQINFNQWGYPGIADLNADGSLDFLVTQNGQPMVTRAFLNNTTVPTDTLKKITYTQGGSSEITYKKSSKYSDSSNNLLNPKLPIALDTVYQIVSKDENNNIINTETYSYEGGEYYFNTHLDRKFAGFNKVIKTDSVGNKTINYFHQGNTTDSSNGEYDDHSSKIGKVYREEVLDNNGNFYKITINKWDKYNQGTNRDFAKLVRSTMLTYDGDSDHKDIAEEYTYENTYGNLTEKISFGEVNANNDGTFTDTGTDKYTENISYASNVADYIVGLVSQNTVLDQSSNKVRESKTYYDNQALGSVNDGNITKVEKWKDGNNYVNTQTSYNTTYGIPISTTDERNNLTTYIYDLYNLYPQIIENPLNQIVKYFYNYSSGKIKQKNDLNNKVYEYKYDGLNRLLEEKISVDIGTPNEPIITPVAQALVVAGGGAGGGNANGSHSGGGGGAGGLRYEYFEPLSVQSYNVTIGKGGRGGYGPEDAENSNFANITAIRGGRGGTGYEPAANGGSGGGAHVGSPLFGLGIEGQGNNGGEEESTYDGGGGGAGFIGGNGGSNGNNGGSGGDGLPNPIIGSTSGENINGIYYLAGGGGGYGYTQGFGGKGGGGSGSSTNCAVNAVDGLPNTGGGGGGECWGGIGADGGSGVVVISYATDGSDGISNTSTGGNITTYGDQTIHTFTSSGIFNVISSYVPSSNPPTMKLKTSYAYNDTSGAVSVLKTDYLDDTNIVSSYQYFDGLNRLVQERKEMENANEYAVRDIKYNSLGLVEKESIPYISLGGAKTSPTTTSNLYKNYTYDPLYRIKNTVDNIGTTTNTYDDWKTSVTDPKGNIKHYYKDAYDNLVKVEEVNAGSTYTTTYNWDLNNKLTKITDALGNIRNFTYDGLGRRLTAEDLHNPFDTEFGVWNYVYDEVGNMIESTNPKSEIVNYKYDVLNRVIGEDYAGLPGLEIFYAYDSCINGVGKLCFVDSLNGPDTEYTYDANGNITNELKIINNSNYSTSYLYDRLNNLTFVTYPDNGEVKYTYNTAGQLEKIERKENGGAYSDVVLDFDYGPHGKVIYQENANGIKTYKTYDADKLYRLTRIQTIDPNTTSLQDLNYSYDANNNITQIVDSGATNASKTVTYTYDDLNRLLSATATNVASGQTPYTENYTYNAVGNIISGPLGFYTYNGLDFNNPHAVSSIGTTNYTYDMNGNMLSGGGLTNTWNYKNQLIQTDTNTDTIEYWYDQNGDRVRTKKNEENTYFINKYSKLNPDQSYLKNIYAGNELVASVKGAVQTGGVNDNTGYKTATNIISNTGWSNFTVARLLADDSARATCSPVCDDNDDGQVGNFSFNIPANATITGIEVLADMSTSSNTEIATKFSLSWDNGNTWTEKKILVQGTNDSYYILGGEYDTWNHSWNNSELENQNLRLKIDKGDSQNTLRIDYLTMKVYYVTQVTNTPLKVEYIHPDHLNSTNVSTDENGAIVNLLDYYPYGSNRIEEGNSINNRKYIGQEFDQDTELNYLNARYYNGSTGKFISQDPVFWILPQELLLDPQQQNSYGYARDNPINGSDPSGLKVEAIAKGIDNNPKGTHVFLLITPDNSKDFGGKSSWVLGGYADQNTGSLIKRINADSDTAVVSSGNLLKSRQVVQSPSGVSDTQFINNIMTQYYNYNEDAAYDPFTINGYNSNNFATTLLQEAGVTNLPWNGNAPGIDPGYGTALPTNYKKADGTNHIPTGTVGALSTVGSYGIKTGYNAVGSAVKNTATSIRNAAVGAWNKLKGN